MLFLANENIPQKSVIYLKEKGHDVKSISKSSPGITDIEVLNIAKKEERIIVTFDRDYGYLIYKENIDFKNGIIYFRYIPSNPVKLGEVLVNLINSGVYFEEYFTIINNESIRQKLSDLIDYQH